MNRQEFSEALAQCRIATGLSMNRMAMNMRFSFTRLKRYERAENNFSVDNVFKYLNSIDYQMVLISNGFSDTYTILSRQDFANAVKTIRHEKGMRQIDVASKAGEIVDSIRKIENCITNTRIDSFLACVNALGGIIKFQKKNGQTRI